MVLGYVHDNENAYNIACHAIGLYMEVHALKYTLMCLRLPNLCVLHLIRAMHNIVLFYQSKLWSQYLKH